MSSSSLPTGFPCGEQTEPPAASLPGPDSAFGGAKPTFPIVAIGTSAGGLEALGQFLAHVPAGSGMAFVIVQHLDPDHAGMLPELLQRVTPMVVLQARNRMKVKPDGVYVIPPNRDLSILHDRLVLLEPVAPRGLRLPIDLFFRALADDRREQAIGVILSGMGSDGCRGLRAIKDAGGRILVQAPESAGFDGMPRSAIDTGLVDVVAPAAELPARLVQLTDTPAQPGPQPMEDKSGADSQHSAFSQICILLLARSGHDFSLYKKSTVYRRIERRMVIHQLDRMLDYVRYLRETPQEADLLFKELLIGVTAFFRDPAVWARLEAEELPALLRTHAAGVGLRAWVAGCSTGEEAYSLAIAFCEVAGRLTLPVRPRLQIFATDLDRDAIDLARKGVYPASIAADLPFDRLKRYFVADGEHYRVTQEIREMVVFAPQNLIMDPPFTRLDMLCCRNV